MLKIRYNKLVPQIFEYDPAIFVGNNFLLILLYCEANFPDNHRPYNYLSNWYYCYPDFVAEQYDCGSGRADKGEAG